MTAGLEGPGILGKQSVRNEESKAEAYSWIKIFGKKTNDTKSRFCLVAKES